MDRITEKYLAEFAKERKLDDLDESKKFEHFACFAVLKQHHNIHFDTDDIVTGEGGDTGIDGIAILVNGSLVTDVELLEQYAADTSSLDVTFLLVQAERSASFSASKIGDFGAGCLDFFSRAPRLQRNDRIIGAAEIQSYIFDNLSSKFKANPSCLLYYVTTGKWVGDQNLQARIDIAREDLANLSQFSNVQYAPVDAEKLQSFYRQTKNAITKTFAFSTKVPVGDITGIKEAYIGFLPSTEFVSLITRETGEMLPGLFDSNVRDWYGYNDVNKEIKATLESSNSDMFVLMNNGITIIASKIVPSGHRLTITDFQIVNGCQTSHVLVDHQALLTDKIMVPVRVIGTEDQALVSAIVRATNRQTEVRDDQFFALQEFPKRLEEHFQAFDELDKKLYYERRTCQYDRLPIEQVRVITEANLIRSFASMFLDEPHRTTRNYRSLREKVGKDIFVKGHKFEPYYLAALAFYRLEMIFKQRLLEPKFKPARFHILMAARMRSTEGGKTIPRMNSDAILSYCYPLIETLWKQREAEHLLLSCANIISDAARGDFQRDNIRTEQFTRNVKLVLSDLDQKTGKGS